MRDMYKGYIYRHWLENKSYIGQTYVETPQQRWGRDGKGYYNQTKFGKAIKKYGKSQRDVFIDGIRACRKLEKFAGFGITSVNFIIYSAFYWFPGEQHFTGDGIFTGEFRYRGRYLFEILFEC